MITKVDCRKSAEFFYKINFIQYLVNKIEPFIILFTAILMIVHMTKGCYNSGYFLLLIFVNFTIKLIMHLIVSKVNSKIYTNFLNYLDNNPILVITNPNRNYNETQRIILYEARVGIQKRLRHFDYTYWLPIERMTNTTLTKIITPDYLYEYFYDFFYMENHFNQFCDDFSKKTTKKILRRTFSESLVNYSQNNSNYNSTSSV